MLVNINYTERDVKKLILSDLADRFDLDLGEKDLNFEVKTNMNYKAEWERGSFRLTIQKEM